jgi:hypothetical protein
MASIANSCFLWVNFLKASILKQLGQMDRNDGSGRNEQSQQRSFHRCFLPSFGSFGQTVSEKNLKNQPIRNKNRQWWPCLLTDRDGMKCSYLYTDLFKSSPLIPLGQMNRNLVGSIYGRSSVAIAHFVPIHLHTWTPQAKSTNQKKVLPAAAMFVNQSGQN